MNRSDRAKWRSARTLPDLGELVIAWLNGEIRETPGHCGPPDAETIPLIPSLTTINRCGFVTDNSQFAESHEGCAWNTWVSGFASDATLTRLREATAGTPLVLTACRGREHECGQRAQEWWRCPWKDMTDCWAARCRRVADELHGCWYVCVSDPEPGRNSLLWPVLERFAQ